MTAPVDNYDDLLLDRYVTIGDSIPGVACSKRLWQIPPGPFPMLIFSKRRATPEHVSGEGKMRIAYRIRARLLGGSLGAGAHTETEDLVNQKSFRVLRTFMLFKQLEEPDANGNPKMGTDLDHLAPEGARVIDEGDITQFDYGDRDEPQQFIGKDYELEVMLLVNKR